MIITNSKNTYCFRVIRPSHGAGRSAAPARRNDRFRHRQEIVVRHLFMIRNTPMPSGRVTTELAGKLLGRRWPDRRPRRQVICAPLLRFGTCRLRKSMVSDRLFGSASRSAIRNFSRRPVSVRPLSPSSTPPGRRSDSATPIAGVGPDTPVAPPARSRLQRE